MFNSNKISSKNIIKNCLNASILSIIFYSWLKYNQIVLIYDLQMINIPFHFFLFIQFLQEINILKGYDLFYNWIYKITNIYILIIRRFFSVYIFTDKSQCSISVLINKNEDLKNNADIVIVLVYIKLNESVDNITYLFFM